MRPSQDLLIGRKGKVRHQSSRRRHRVVRVPNKEEARSGEVQPVVFGRTGPSEEGIWSIDPIWPSAPVRKDRRRSNSIDRPSSRKGNGGLSEEPRVLSEVC